MQIHVEEVQQFELEKLKLEHSSLPFQRPVAQDAMKATLVKSSTNHTELHRSVISLTSCILWCRKPHSKCFKKFLSWCRLPQSKQGGFNSESGERSASVSKVAAVSFHLGSCAALASVVNSSPRVNRTLLTPPFILPASVPPSPCLSAFQVSVPNSQLEKTSKSVGGGVESHQFPPQMFGD